MDEHFSTEVEQVDGAMVIHVRGEIDVATCERLRDAIEPHLGPKQTIVLDLSRVQFMDSSSLHVLEQARGTLTADGGSLILRNPSEAARRLLTAAGTEHLLDEDAEMHPPRTVLPLAYDESSASAARRLVRQFGAQHNLGSTEDESLIASELVTNAVRHGGEPVELTLQHQDDELTIEVADGDPRIDEVRMRAVDRSRPGGRGLRIVASLAKRWGVRPFRSGKQVWAATDAPPEGKADRHAGKAKEKLGHARDKVEEVVDKVAHKAEELIDKAKDALHRK